MSDSDENTANQLLYVRASQRIKLRYNWLKIATGFDEKTLFTTQSGRELVLTLIEQPEDEFKLVVTVQTDYVLKVKDKRHRAFNILIENGNEINTEDPACPPTVVDCISPNRLAWTTDGTQFLKLLAWRFDCPMDFSSIEETLSCSLDEQKWVSILHPLPEIYFSAWTTGDDNNKKSEIQSLLREGVTPPLAIDLLDEALRIINTNPRSALALATTALEVGTKHFIALRRPKMGLSIAKIQSPSVEFLLTYLVPEIEPAFIATEELLSTVKNTVQTRNELVHQGKFNLNFHQIHDRIYTIRDILNLFEALNGNNWSLSRIDFKRIGYQKSDMDHVLQVVKQSYYQRILSQQVPQGINNQEPSPDC